MAVQNWVKELTEEVTGGSPFEIGDVVKHPDGRTVKIVGGQYWGEHGLSNFWNWSEVLPDGTLSTKKECGYGWHNTPRGIKTWRDNGHDHNNCAENA